MHPPEDVSTYARPPFVEAVEQQATIHAGGVVICSTSREAQLGA